MQEIKENVRLALDAQSELALESRQKSAAKAASFCIKEGKNPQTPFVARCNNCGSMFEAAASDVYYKYQTFAVGLDGEKFHCHVCLHPLKFTPKPAIPEYIYEDAVPWENSKGSMDLI